MTLGPDVGTIKVFGPFEVILAFASEVLACPTLRSISRAWESPTSRPPSAPKRSWPCRVNDCSWHASPGLSNMCHVLAESGSLGRLFKRSRERDSCSKGPSEDRKPPSQLQARRPVSH